TRRPRATARSPRIRCRSRTPARTWRRSTRRRWRRCRRSSRACAGDAETMADFDAIVIGSGAGGSMAALAFAKKGLKVLVLEKGENYYPDLEGGGTSTVFRNESVFG